MDNMILRIIEKLDSTGENYLKITLKRILSTYDMETIKKLFPILTKKPYFDIIAHTLFSYLLDNRHYFNNEIIYLLNIRKPKLSYLKAYDVVMILDMKNGLEYLLDNIYELNCNDQEVIKELTMAVIDSKNDLDINEDDSLSCGIFDKLRNFLNKTNTTLNLKDFISSPIVQEDYFEILLNYIIHIPNGTTKTTFFELLIKYNYSFDLNSILIAHHKNPDDYLRSLQEGKTYEGDIIPSGVPYMLSSYLYQNNDIKKFILDNFDQLLEIEDDSKFFFIHSLRFFGRTRKYRCIIDLFNTSRYLNFEQFNLIFKRHEEKCIINYIDGKTVIYESEGTCAEVFRVGEDKVLKISVKKYVHNSITEHFLICPTEQKIIYDDNELPKLYIEFQPYLKKEHNGKPICEDDIINFLNELKKYNINLTDETCLRHDPRNFGFLKDYHDATLVGIENIEDAPEWWKKRPIVIYDVDMMLELTNQVKRSLKQ